MMDRRGSEIMLRSYGNQQSILRYTGALPSTGLGPEIFACVPAEIVRMHYG
jgi:hypothetical protein